VLDEWDRGGLPVEDRVQVAYSLGQNLQSYLTLAVENGTTLDAIEEVVGDEPELLPYRARLEAGERAYRDDRRREQGQYVPRYDPTPRPWNPWG
jgi:hypothetical protein